MGQNFPFSCVNACACQYSFSLGILTSCTFVLDCACACVTTYS